MTCDESAPATWIPMLKETGRHIHDSAAVHSRALAKALDKYTVDASEMQASLPPQRKLSTSCVEHEDAWPTRVVQMDLDDDLVKNLRRELLLGSKIEEAVAGRGAGVYGPLSTQFENSFLFLPSAQQFYRRNKQIIHSTFPEIDTASVNAFVVPANKHAFGVHSAGSIGFQVPALARRGFAYPKKHVSFHTALTPTPLDRQPLSVFEDVAVESPNSSFSYEFIRSHDLTDEEVATVDKALYLHDSGKLLAIDIQAVQNYLLCKYWEKKYPSGSEGGKGYYCDVDVGQAVVFDNYRPHGDSTLDPSPTERVTIDIRCTSRALYPTKEITSGVDLLLDPENRRRQKDAKRDSIECLLMLLGYEDIGEFLQLIYGTTEIDPFELTNDIQVSVYNATENYALEKDLDAHYERVLEVYDRIEREGGFAPTERALRAMNALAEV